MGLIDYNKRFLYLAISAPDNAHDACLLKHTPLFKEIANDEGILNKSSSLGELNSIPLVKVDDSAFSPLQWVIKGYNENTRDPKESFFNTKLCSARVAKENTDGMLKRRWRRIYKKCKCQLRNIKYMIMASVFLHNQCISMNEPWKPI